MLAGGQHMQAKVMYLSVNFFDAGGKLSVES